MFESELSKRKYILSIMLFMSGSGDNSGDGLYDKSRGGSFNGGRCLSAKAGRGYGKRDRSIFLQTAVNAN